MVVGAFPAAKLGVLAMKQISKPIANIIKTRAKNSPFFRKYICMPPAQFYNFFEVKTKMWALNLGKPTVVPALNEAMAIDLGANLLGEIIIFVIGAGLLLLEYQRQVRKEAHKEEMILQEKLELQATINELIFSVQKQDTQLREMSRIVADLESKSSWNILNGMSPFSKKSEGEKEKPVYIPPTPPPKEVSNNLNANNSTKNNDAQQMNFTHETTGNYYPESGILFPALNLIVNEVFYSPSPDDDDNDDDKFPNRRQGFIEKALVHLFDESFIS